MVLLVVADIERSKQGEELKDDTDPQDCGRHHGDRGPFSRRFERPESKERERETEKEGLRRQESLPVAIRNDAHDSDPEPSSRSARKTVTAWPESRTRSPFTRTFRTPPRAESCRARRSSLRSRPLQKGPRQQWAEPVTGSSLIPNAGAKKRDTKSNSGLAERLVTITPRPPSAPRAPKSGRRPRMVSSSSSRTR